MSTSDRTSLGDRMKSYEIAFRTVLPPRMPVILRVDGKAFHTYTKDCAKPFDDALIDGMNQTAIALCKNIQGAQIAYVQSDEISVLVHNYKSFDTQPWFDNEIQKMASVSASIAAATMTVASKDIFGEIKPAYFDSRVFVLPESEVCNYFLWRQQDASRNSIQMLARSLYSHKECDRKDGSMLQEMCFQKGKNWNDIPTRYRRGRCVVRETYTTEAVVNLSMELAPVLRSRWAVDNEIPKFSDDRSYINRLLEIKPE